MYSKYNDEYAAGGVIVFVDNKFTVNLIEWNWTTADCVLLDIKIDNSYVSLVAIYRLHAFSRKTFLNQFEQRFEKIKSNAVILGDMNSNILIYNSDAKERTIRK